MALASAGAVLFSFKFQSDALGHRSTEDLRRWVHRVSDIAGYGVE